MKYFKFLMILCSLSIVSCEDELDIEPQQSVSEGVATATADNIEAVLLGAYSTSRNNHDGDLANIGVLFGNTDQADWNGTFQTLRDIYFKDLVNSSGVPNTVYGNGYALFADTNLVLENLDVFTDPTRKDMIEGEAKFLRGVVLFDLVRLFGQQYNASGNNTQEAVPVVTGGPDIDRLVPRNTVEEVYTQLLSDLQDAYAKLPSANGNRADKYAAQAILARVYLQQGNYSAAREAANDVIENSGHSLTSTFAGAFGSDDNTSESIFSFIVTVQEGVNTQNTHFATEALGGRGGDIAITQDYLDKFDSPLDDRGNFNYVAEGITLSSKFIRQYANTEHIRLAEMHLIRAECNFREATTVGMTPLVEINAVRARSNAPALAALTIDLILNERELELGFEGFALHDYKRTQRNIGGLPYNDNSLIFPIPQSARDRNSLLTQNDGY